MAYTPKTRFERKDALPQDDPKKIIYGAEFAVEFDAISATFDEVQSGFDQVKDKLEAGGYSMEEAPAGGSQYGRQEVNGTMTWTVVNTSSGDGSSYDDTQIKADLATETQARINGDTALGLRIDSVEDSITDGGGFVDAPNDGKLYGRQSEGWSEVPEGGVSDWADIENKPTEFPPADHDQPWSSITDTPDDYPPSAHDHTIANVTGLSDALDGKSDVGHKHVIADVTGLQDALNNAAYAVAISDTPPENGKSGDTWFDSKEGEGALYIHDGDVWFSSNTFSRGASGGGGGGGSLEAVASGTLATGDTVIVNADGTVSVVEGEQITASVPNDVMKLDNVNNGSSTTGLRLSSCMDEKNNRLVSAHILSNNYGAVVVSEFQSDGTMVAGPPVIYASEALKAPGVVYDEQAERVVIGDHRAGDTRLGFTTLDISPETNTATVVDVDNSSLIWMDKYREPSNKPTYHAGTGHTVFSTGRVTATYYTDAVTVAVKVKSNGLIEYVKQTVHSYFGYIKGKPPQLVSDPSTGKLLYAYQKGDEPYNCRLATASITSDGAISFIGHEPKIETGTGEPPILLYDPVRKLFLVIMQLKDEDQKGAFTVGISALDGTLKVGEVTTLAPAYPDEAKHNHGCYNPVSGRFVITYRTSGDVGQYLETWITESGLIGVGEVKNSDVRFHTVTYDPVTNYMALVGAFNSENGPHVQTFTVDAFLTNLTDTNYIGVSSADYADGDTATIQTIGSVSEDQSGLTAGLAYYVQLDGSLGTSGNVFAGTAVSPTNLIVKG